MPRTTKPMSERIEKAKTELRQTENHLNELLQKKNLLERKQRTRRLIERGAIAESLIDGADTLTNEQFKIILQSALENNSPAH